MKLYLLALTFFIFSSCEGNPDVKFDKQPLVTFFETDSIDISSKGKIITVNISGSKRLNAKTQYDTTGGLSEGSIDRNDLLLDQYCSKGAIILYASSPELASNYDSVLICVRSAIGNVHVAYGFATLDEVTKNMEVCRSFLQSLNEQDYDRTKAYLTGQIVSSIPLDSFFSKFSTYFPNEQSRRFDFSGFFLSDGAIALYHKTLVNGIERFYFFAFLPHDRKIAGLSAID